MARKKKPVRRKRAGGTPIGGSARRKKPRRRKAGGTKVGGGTGIGGGMRRKRKRAPRAGFIGEIAKHLLLGYALNKLGLMGH